MWYAILDVAFVSLFLTGPSNILNNTLNMLCLAVIVSQLSIFQTDKLSLETCYITPQCQHSNQPYIKQSTVCPDSNSRVNACVHVCRCVYAAVGSGGADTHTLCRTHQPQWGSPEARHSLQLLYCSQLSTGTRLTCTHTTLRISQLNLTSSYFGMDLYLQLPLESISH